MVYSNGAPVAGPPVFDEPEGECRKSPESAVKPRFDLVPWAAVEEIAEVLTFGASKYEDNNWTRGARWGRYFAALCRHIFAWWRGEDRDPETGMSHLAHAGCDLIFLMEYQRNGWGTDDRFRGPDKQPFQKHDGDGPIESVAAMELREAEAFGLISRGPLDQAAAKAVEEKEDSLFPWRRASPSPDNHRPAR